MFIGMDTEEVAALKKFKVDKELEDERKRAIGREASKRKVITNFANCVLMCLFAGSEISITWNLRSS